MRRACLVLILLAHCAGSRPSPAPESAAPAGVVVAPPEHPERPEDDAAAPLSESSLGAAVNAQCPGAATRELIDELTRRAQETRPCYERALRANPKLFGRLVVKMRVEGDGVVATAIIVKDDLHDPDLARCVVGLFEQNLMSSPSGGCVYVAIPLNFQPKPAADGGVDSGP